MTTPTDPGTYDRHSGPTGAAWTEFRERVWLAQHPKQSPKAGDGAARSPRAAAASPSQPAPSPRPTTTGGAR